MTGEFERELLNQLDMLHNLTRRLTNTQHDADDLLQDTCLASWQAWASHGPPRDPRAWWATICLNLARSRWRQRQSRPVERPAMQIEDTVGRAGTHGAGAQLAGGRLPGGQVLGGHVEVEALANLQAATVHQQLARLPHHQREAIVLMDLCGFTASQVGEMLELPRGTILSRVHRGHKALALLMDEAKLR